MFSVRLGGVKTSRVGRTNQNKLNDAAQATGNAQQKRLVGTMESRAEAKSIRPWERAKRLKLEARSLASNPPGMPNLDKGAEKRGSGNR